MRRKATVGFCSLGVLIFASVAALCGPGDAAAGKTVYSTYCASCHGEDGRPAADGVPDFSSKTFQDSKTDEQLAAAIRDGNGGMPGMSSMLTDPDVANVIAWIRTLAQ